MSKEDSETAAKKMKAMLTGKWKQPQGRRWRGNVTFETATYSPKVVSVQLNGVEMFQIIFLQKEQDWTLATQSFKTEFYSVGPAEAFSQAWAFAIKYALGESI